MKANYRLLLFLSLCALCTSGCIYRYPTEKNRRDSYAPLQTTLGSTTMEAHMRARSAFIISGSDLKSETANDGSLQLNTASGLRPSFAAATAIDTRGYYLTAAHATHEKDILLIPLDGSLATPVPARVVWRGSASLHQDLALLYVPVKVTNTFQWGDSEVRIGDPVYLIGPSSLTGDSASPLLFAGLVCGRSEPTADSGTPVVITHDAPGAPGDSGGPLVSANGRLIGITTGARRFLSIASSTGSIKFRLPFLRPLATAQRPRAADIQKIIEADQAKMVIGR
ncbi:MAG: trypsin-like peptidase domain-containing protein [Undibacterium sp.]|nr:trypsin-like peptidase domain-containing protein [Opitutaceae bacterium]